MDKTIEKGVSEIVGALADPIFVFPGGWGDTLPEWLKTTITLERLVMNMQALKGEEMTGTDAEACAYLYTASLTAPMGHDWSQIYLYIAGKTYEKWRTKDSGVSMPEDIHVEKLDRNQEDDLLQLKRWIYQTRLKHRKAKAGDIQKEIKQEEAEQKKEAQPALFDF